MTAARLHHGWRRFYPSAPVCVILVICFVPVLTCQDPGTVAHSHRILTGSRFTVGATVQFICNKGYVLSGNSLLTCYNRDSAAPKWSERLPKCVRKSTSAWKTQSEGCLQIWATLGSLTVFVALSAEKYEPCRNPGAASTSMQNSEKAFYQAGEMLTFSCHPGYELQGEATIYCIPGHPSQWNNTPPACRGESTS